MADNTPRELGGRYEVGELIGRGGMAEVHIGHDRRLGRTVAIKILRSDLARDPAFLARFAKEAQSAAALNHPAIVAVYDTGEDTFPDPTTGATIHVPYIVMEYVEGHTVREILNHGDAVPIDEAVEITSGVLSALSYSHQAGIIHRDIKPGNVMITPTGAVKVMDFGIARAVADSAMTQTQAVIGTAQYLSPEQARGENVDTRSDIYSTGCLLFELLTGRPPFVGDSPVAVAYQHVGQNPQAPSDIASDVPQDLDRITLKALAKERAARYSTAAEFQADLENFLAGNPVFVPAPDANATRVIGVTPDSTTVMPHATAVLPAGAGGLDGRQRPGGVVPGGSGFDNDATAIHPRGLGAVPPAIPVALPPNQYGQPYGQYPGQPGQPGQYSPGHPGAPGYGQSLSYPPQANRAQVPAWGPLNQGGYPGTQGVPIVHEPAPSNKGKILLFTLLPLLVLAAGILTYFFTRTEEPTVAPPVNVTVPLLATGSVATQQEVCDQIEAAHLICDPRVDAESNEQAGTLLRQEPVGGVEAPEGSNVVVWFSGGPNTVAVPGLVGMTLAQAEARLAEVGLILGQVTPENSATEAEGHITGSQPVPNQAVSTGDRVNVSVSTGLVDLPELVGMPENQALTLLNSLRLRTGERIEQVSLDRQPGTVIAQTPAAGDVEQGSEVELIIAIAPEPEMIAVPDIAGQAWTYAQDHLVGLNSRVVTDNNDVVPPGYVISTDPAAGTEVVEGTVITVTLSSGPAAPGEVEYPTDPLEPNDPYYSGGDETEG
ncbi:MAG: Stk1 family PASTA domain-containing Ser/Thr kinase [Cellulomonadaceae bacterium]|nr:Stk1 family PASTA domain-containing Ser/Thr kinase [Cellulomonadaceae bacterium]